jgi:hypothetical protein
MNSVAPPSRISACRREPNSHEAAEPRDADQRWQRATQAPPVGCKRAKYHGQLKVSESAKDQDQVPSHHIDKLHCVGSISFRLVRWAAASSIAAIGHGLLSRRLKFLTGKNCPRGARSTCATPPGNTGSGQARPRPRPNTALPNPSFKWTANGLSHFPVGAMPAAHFAPPAQRTKPLAAT